VRRFNIPVRRVVVITALTGLGVLTTAVTAAADEPCPYPGDTVRCLQWDLEQQLHKFSLG
jgi:hypothetical protein